MNYIVDTNILMKGIDLAKFDRVYVPLPVLEELDNHNHSTNPEKAYKARCGMRYLKESEQTSDNIVYQSEYDVGIWAEVPDWFDDDKKDNLILVYAIHIQNLDKSAVLMTCDLNMYQKARALGVVVEIYCEKEKDPYKGYLEYTFPTREEMTDFYSNLDNRWGLLENQYIIFRFEDGIEPDVMKWTSAGFKALKTKAFKSQYFDDIKPMEDDLVQKCAFDSLYSDDISVLFGKSGCGKTTLSLGFLMQQLNNNKIKKIYVVHSFETLKNNKTLGFLPGTKNEKILGSGLGNILTTKFGDITPIMGLIASNRMEIIPTADLRGVEFGKEDAVYITEAQNTDSYTMRTLIQRCKLGCKIIVEGDMLEQVDIRAEVNGMERLIEVFKGSEYFSCVKLKENYRNPIVELAQKI